MATIGASAPTAKLESMSSNRLACLRLLERKVLWLSTWMIHHANHVRPKRDGLKVGGHQASSASLVSMMTALYFDVLRDEDRVAVKPHAAPVFHAIQYLLGHLDLDRMKAFRALGGLQSYPSRTKDPDDVDISTGSVGLGAAHTLFSSLAQEYVRSKGFRAEEAADGRMVALVGDAELDEGNIFEALLEGWKKDVRNVWWVVDYNRQSLDSIITERLFARIDDLFRAMGWRVETLKYGKLLDRAFSQIGGDALKHWIDICPNSLYSALTYKGGAAWREYLMKDIGDVVGVKALLDEYDDDLLQMLMTNLGGNDLEAALEAFHAIDDDVPTCFIGYTTKGFGLPLAGHKDNHAGLMNKDQMDRFRAEMGIVEGDEWDRFAGLGVDEEGVAAEIAQALKSDDSNVRQAAIRRLSIMEVIDVNLLRTALNDPSPRVLDAAVSLVAKRPELNEDSEIEGLLITIAMGKEGPMRTAAIGVLASKTLGSPKITALVLDLTEGGSAGLVSSLATGLRGIPWWQVEGLANRLMTTADDRLVARLLRGEGSDEAVPIRNAILSDPSKSTVLRARLIEDLIGRRVDETTLDIVSSLSKSDDESLSAISRSLLFEASSLN